MLFGNLGVLPLIVDFIKHLELFRLLLRDRPRVAFQAAAFRKLKPSLTGTKLTKNASIYTLGTKYAKTFLLQ